MYTYGMRTGQSCTCEHSQCVGAQMPEVVKANVQYAEIVVTAMISGL